MKTPLARAVLVFATRSVRTAPCFRAHDTPSPRYPRCPALCGAQQSKQSGSSLLIESCNQRPSGATKIPEETRRRKGVDSRSLARESARASRRRAKPPAPLQQGIPSQI
jgi:hypothetical protein